MDIPATRAAAIKEGRKHYLTGKPCKHGHNTFRFTKTAQCDECVRRDHKAWSKANPEKGRAYSRRWAAKNPDANKRSLWKKLGMPEPLRSKPSRCELRGCPPGPRGLYSDHDHATGKWRGWICFRCNSGIGLLGDTLEDVKKAVAYLEKNT